MKRQIYICTILLIISIFTSCKEDSTSTNDHAIQAQKEALLQQTQIGMYQNGKLTYGFDKQAHQLYIYPSQRIFRIQVDAGDKYLELRLNTSPTTDTIVKGSLIDNTDTNVSWPVSIRLLKSSDDMLWLWDEAANKGFIMPWITE